MKPVGIFAKIMVKSANQVEESMENEVREEAQWVATKDRKRHPSFSKKENRNVSQQTPTKQAKPFLVNINSNLEPKCTLLAKNSVRPPSSSQFLARALILSRKIALMLQSLQKQAFLVQIQSESNPESQNKTK